MTVSNKVPIAEYNGNGVITEFQWDWDMIEDSSIHVRVNNVNVTDWSLEGNSVVFDTAPVGEIQIYRRTKIWMPENYVPFGRFHYEKTELSVDRATMIAQERAGGRGTGNAPDGIVGGADLSITRGEFTVTVNSERGSDAVVPMYDPDDIPPTPPGPPSPSIIWAGDDISGGGFATVSLEAIIRFRMDLTGGEPTEASAVYPDFNTTTYVGWVDVDPLDDEYWMRVTAGGDIPVESRYIIFDGVSSRALGDEFKIRAAPVSPTDAVVDRNGDIVVDRNGVVVYPRGVPDFEEGVYGPYVGVHTFGDTAPSTQIGTFDIEICKDDNGVPDGAWVSRVVTMEAIFNA